MKSLLKIQIILVLVCAMGNNVSAQSCPQSLTISSSTGSYYICPGGSNISYTVDYSGSTNASYSWNVDGGTIISGYGTASIEVSWQNEFGGISVTVTDNICEPDIFPPCNDLCYSSQPYWVSTGVSAVAFASGPTTFCSGGAVSLNAGTGSGYAYQWKKDAANISGATSASYSATQTGGYTVQVTANGCMRESSPAINVSVIASPSQPAINSQSTQVIPGAVLLTATNGTSYQWYKDGNPVSTGSALPAMLSGTYTVANTENGCANFSTPVSISSGTNNNNLIVSNDVKVPGVTSEQGLYTLPISNLQQTIAYADGLGRPVQSILRQELPGQYDLIQPAQYDGLGRQKKSYLPFGTTQYTGMPLSNPLGATPANYNTSAQYLFYNPGAEGVPTDTKPLTETDFELSPLGRAIHQGNLGDGFQPGQADSDISYGSNGDNDIRVWTINANLPVSSTTWNSFQLQVVTITDPQGSTSQKVTNMDGLKIMDRVQIDATNWVETYYIYDNRNRLRFLLPPELMRILKVDGFRNPTQSEINAWAFQYLYGDEGRVVEKKNPGAESIYTVYDKRDRVVLTQDGRQRVANEWSYLKYDNLNRSVIKGIYRPGSTISRTVMQGNVNGLSGSQGYQNITARVESGVKVGLDIIVPAYEGINEYKAVNTVVIKPGFVFTAGTTATSFRAHIDNGSGGVEADVFPNTNDEDLIITYYDSYKDCAVCQDGAYQFSNEDWGSTTSNEPFQKSDRIVDKIVATSVKVLNSSQWLYDVTYYNRQGNVIQTISTNHRGGLLRSSSLLDFSSKPLKVISWTDGIKTTRTFDYDQAGRVLKAYHQINAQPKVTISMHEYNVLGQEIGRNLHSTNNGPYLQSLDYRSNIRGGITRFNNTNSTDNKDSGDPAADYFSMEFAYHNTFDAAHSANSRNDGFFSAVKWKDDITKSGSTHRYEKLYNFTYSKQGYLTAANFKVKDNGLTPTGWDLHLNKYTEDGFTYDRNGNILTLKRNSGTPIDDLSYNYNSTSGNQLKYVGDISGSEAGFNNYNNANDDYSYDANGNLIQDKNKKISSILYNDLDLVKKVNFDNGSYVENYYTATGVKIKSISNIDMGSPTGFVKTEQDYVGNFVYINGGLLLMQHEAGRILPPSNTNLVPQSVRECNTFSGIATVQSVTLSSEFLNGETYVKAVCNQSGGSPGISSFGAQITVVPGATYSYKILGYQNSGSIANLVVRSAAGTNIIWPGPPLPVGASNENFVTSTFTVPSNVTQIRLGVEWTNATSGKTFYINRVSLYKTDFEYQYYLSDHQGSPRVVLQSEAPTHVYSATMESEAHANENTTWLNLKSSQYREHIYANVTAGGNEAIEMSNAYRIGPARSFKVFPGDVINASVQAYYTNTTGFTDANATTMAGALFTALTGTSFAVDGTAITQLYNATPTTLIDLSPWKGSNRPSAFLNYILFDENYIPLRAKSFPVEELPGTRHQVQFDSDLTIEELGYLFVYLSYDNENSDQPVYFDDFKITYKESPVIQVNAYYPYGLIAYTWSREGETENKYLYQNKELTKETGWQDFGSRTYSSDLGRWFAMDPQGQFNSPYVSMGNIPTMGVDPNGEWAFIVGAIVGAYMGGTLANEGQMNPVKWDYDGQTVGHMVAGGMFGALSGGASQAIAASGIPFANTASIAAGSFLNSYGTHIYTGGETDLSIGFGAASYNLSDDEWGYLGKRGNSRMENIGYGFGALANFQDIIAGVHGTEIDVKSRPKLAGHSETSGKYSVYDSKTKLTTVNDITISVGPDVNLTPKINTDLGWEWEYVRRSLKWDPVKGQNVSYIDASDPQIVTHLNNVNGKWLSNMTSRLNSGRNLMNSGPLKYGLLYGCVNYNARALFGAGVINLNALLPVTPPVLLNVELGLRQVGIYASPYLTTY